MIPASTLGRSQLIVPATFLALALVLGQAAWAQEQPAATQPDYTRPSTSPPASRPAEAEAMLRLIEKRYRAAKTYRDEGVVRIKMIQKGATIEDERPFSTAFERNGRFRWEFRASAIPGGRPKLQYVVWSRDQKTFDSWWDVTRKHQQHNSLDMAMAGPTGVSGGSATAIIPMLCKMQWGLRCTNVVNPTVQGPEKIQGVDCTIIEGQDSAGGQVRLWLDSSSAVYQVFTSREVDPAKLPKRDGQPENIPQEKFVVETTITIKPTFDAKIADEEFDFKPPASETPGQ
jgi:hypothetical protein